MRQARSLHNETFNAPSAVSAYRFVDWTGAQITAQGAKVAAGALVDAAIGEDYAGTVIGTAVIETGGVFSKGDRLISDAQGRAIATTGEISIEAGATQVTSSAANGAILTGGELPEHVCAVALQDSDGAGKFAEVLMLLNS